MNEQIKQRITQLNNGEVPNGYEKTDFGIFPCDWVKGKTFGDLFDFYGGLGKSRDELGDKGHAYLHYGDLHRGAFNIVSHEQYEQLPKYDVALKGTETYLMEDGNVAFLDASEDLEGTSRAVLIDNPDNEPFIAGLHIIYGKSKDESLEKWYKQYITSSESVRKQFQRLAAGFKVYGVNRDTLPRIQVAYPKSTEEQSKIAEILMKWDEAIELQEQYIECCTKIKKGFFKKLFSFDEGTSSYVRLGDAVVSMASGGTPLTSKSEYFDGDIVWVSIDDITKCDKYITDSARKLTVAGIDNSSAKLFPAGTILYAMYASIGKCAIADVECSSSQAILGIVPNADILDTQYLYYYLCSIQESIALQGQQGTQSNLNKKMVESFQIPVPTNERGVDLQKQKYIASVLINMDEVISMHKTKQEKLKTQRKTLQQYLLNGIVRVK